MSSTEVDPLEQTSRPALSFKDVPIGTAYTGRVIEEAKLVQSRDYESGDLAYWPDGNPKMSVVLGIDVDGQEYSVWAAKPSALLAALVDAQRSAGTKIAAGGTLTITYTGDKPNPDKPKLSPQKLYSARYVGVDPLSQVGGQPSAPTAPPVSAPAPAPMSAPAPAPAAQPAPAAPQAESPADMARKLLAIGMTDEQVAQATGLDASVVAILRSVAA